jgi:2-polyprenyl-3-methyl-5-hydroxy-6-metoxy-1,4-benzoquinol methylase
MKPEKSIEAAEAEFHDKWAMSGDGELENWHDAFQGVTAPENHFIINELGDLRGKKVLELGAGFGEFSLLAAEKGAEVLATDISSEMMTRLQKRADSKKIKLNTKTVSANDLKNMAPSSFDVVYAANLLHHVDIQECIDQVLYVLKPGGVACFWDPIEYNPAIQIYRGKAAEVRTVDEHPLRIRDLNLIKSKFSKVTTRFFWLSALIVFFKFYFIDRLNPSKHRYWKLILEKHRQLQWLGVFHKVDKMIFNLFPPLKWWAWNVAIIAKK